MILDKLFQLMSEKHASDIFISAGAPIHIKIQGNTIPVNQQVMLPDMIEKIAYELMSPDQIKTFDANWEMNLSFGVPNVGNFRVNIFRQRGSTSIVIRFILGNIPALDELGLPAERIGATAGRRGRLRSPRRMCWVIPLGPGCASPSHCGRPRVLRAKIGKHCRTAARIVERGDRADDGV
jgi:Tfp pilus assembly ATPase PilU